MPETVHSSGEQSPEESSAPVPDSREGQLTLDNQTTVSSLASLRRTVEKTRVDLVDDIKKGFGADLYSPSPARRCRAAAFGLGSLPSTVEDAVIPMIIDGWQLLAQDKNADVRAVLVTNLGFAHYFPHLFEDLLADPDKKIQLSAIEKSLPFAFNPPEKIVALYLSAPSTEVRLAMIRRWSPGLGAVEEACATLADPDPQVKHAAQASPFSYWLRQPDLLRLYHQFMSRHRG